nr:MAG TPA: hypothetical protein [Caudoviricetes sp.]
MIILCRGCLDFPNAHGFFVFSIFYLKFRKTVQSLSLPRL